MKLKYLTVALATCLFIGCVDEDRDADLADQQKVDAEVHTAQQSSYDTMEACKAEFAQDGDCVLVPEEKKTFTSEEDCKKNSPDPTLCKSEPVVVDKTTTIVNNGGGGNNGGINNALLWYAILRPHYVSPIYYPWGAVYHNNGTYSYNQRVPTNTGRPVAATTLASRNIRPPEFNNASSYSTSRMSTLSAARPASVSRGGFGSTGAHASGSVGG